MKASRIAEIYQILDEISFLIPNFCTPDEIISSIHHCRSRINKVEKLAIEVNRSRSLLRTKLLGKKKERQIKYNDLLRNNAEVKKGKSGLDRQAIAESLLSEIDIEIADFESQVTEIKYLAEAIDLRISNLNKTNSDIRLAWSIMQNTSNISNVPELQETDITSEDLESLDIRVASKKPQKDFEQEDFSSLNKEKSTEEKLKEVELEKDTEEVFLNLDDEEVEEPVNLEESFVLDTKEPESKSKEPESKPKKSESKPKKSDEEDILESSFSGDIDVEEFLADLD